MPKLKDLHLITFTQRRVSVPFEKMQLENFTCVSLKYIIPVTVVLNKEINNIFLSCRELNLEVGKGISVDELQIFCY